MSCHLTYTMLTMLEQGRDRLTQPALQMVTDYVKTQRTANDAFVNRGNIGDVYYTMFGWMLCRVLHIPTQRKNRQAYLNSIDQAGLDEAHQVAYNMCRLLNRMLLLGIPTRLVPLADYEADTLLRRFIKAYIVHGNGTGTNAIAARILLGESQDSLHNESTGSLHNESQDGQKTNVARLMALQTDTGGFMANEGATMPDLLSTAIASMALHSINVKPHYDVTDFVDAHWMSEGGFAATLASDDSDVEYVTYALMALGG
ncbi:MAG: hypothetical protein IJ557_05350 [Bacteroidaceae bacterium]|nr:hypothetical protein [Bacteroidaceae bacterium]